MNKTELLAALAAKYHYVGSPTTIETVGPIRRYQVAVFDVLGEAMRQGAISFFVENEGLGNEVAYWYVKEPLAEAESNFARAVNAYIADRVAAGVILGAVVVAIDEANERAIAWAYVTQQANINEVKVLLRRSSPGGPITHAVINTVLHTGG